MSIYKRGKVYWYKFMWNGDVIRESTRQVNQTTARNMESAHRTALANGLVGIRSKKPDPMERDFCASRFEPWAKSTFEKNARNNWLWFRGGIRALLAFRPLASARLEHSRMSWPQGSRRIAAAGTGLDCQQLATRLEADPWARRGVGSARDTAHNLLDPGRAPPRDRRYAGSRACISIMRQSR